MRIVSVLSILMFISVFCVSVQAVAEPLSIWSEQTYPGIVESGNQGVSLHVTLINNANRVFEDVSLKAEFQAPFTAVSDEYDLGTMKPADRFTAVFVFNVGMATSGVYTMPLRLTYFDGGSLIVTAKELHISISSEPQLELKDLDMVIEPGKFQDISFTMKNNGGLMYSNIEVSLDTDVSIAYVQTPIFVDNLLPNEEKKVIFNVQISRETEPKIYDLTINIKTSEEDITKYVGLIVQGKPTVNIAGTSTSEDPKVGHKFSLSIELENTGTGDARSTVAKIISDKISGNLEQYVGTIDADDSESAIFDITLPDAGPNEILLELTYEDDYDNVYSFQETISVYATPDSVDILILVVVIALVLGVIAFLYNRKQKIKLLKKVH